MPRTAGDEGRHPVDQHVGRRVPTKRLSLGRSQTELGEALGLTFQRVQKYERRQQGFGVQAPGRIAEYFQVDIRYFFEGLADRVGEIESEPFLTTDQ